MSEQAKTAQSPGSKVDGVVDVGVDERPGWGLYHARRAQLEAYREDLERWDAWVGGGKQGTMPPPPMLVLGNI